MIRAFLNEYSDSSTSAYQELAANVTKEVGRVYKKVHPLTYLRCRVIQFTNGSIIAKLALIFKNSTVVPSASTVRQEFIDAVYQDNTILNVDATSITAGTPTTASSLLTIFLVVLSHLLHYY
ncbi:unnamed protein product [Oncorhynchus mykiss]|uniref:SEA domain-containing protein n=2 Tax=Oncorhynchus TaxID=8016 RepID=A0A060WV83_ONCMY|nr:unnamed protein product [Oncorhynchus mykiss]